MMTSAVSLPHGPTNLPELTIYCDGVIGVLAIWCRDRGRHKCSSQRPIGGREG